MDPKTNEKPLGDYSMTGIPNSGATSQPDFLYKWGSIIAVAVVLILAVPLSGSFLFVFSFKENVFDFDTVLNLIGPALIAALFVERAVEVVVTAWRKLGRDKLTAELAKIIEASQPSQNANASQRGNENSATRREPDPDLQESITKKRDELVKYRRGTLQMAVAFSVFFSFILTVIGVRLLGQFFEIPYLECVNGTEIEPEECPSGIDTIRSQFRWLTGTDILLTTFIISGGSEGLHSIVKAITRAADRTATTPSPTS